MLKRRMTPEQVFDWHKERAKKYRIFKDLHSTTELWAKEHDAMADTIKSLIASQQEAFEAGRQQGFEEGFNEAWMEASERCDD